MIARTTPIARPLVLGLGLVVVLLTVLAVLPVLSVAGAPAQTGAITGTIRDIHGAPLADTMVWAQPYSGDPGGGGAVSDAGGVYAITGLTTGDYRVVAEKPGYVRQLYNNVLNWENATPVHVSDGITTPNIDFVLSRAGYIRGRVLTRDGSAPIPDAEVWAEHWDHSPGGGHALADANGYYTLTVAAGQYRVGARKLPYHIQTFYQDTVQWEKATPVSVSEGGSVSGIDFRLGLGGLIRGRVTDADTGQPLVQAWVRAGAADGSPTGVGTNEIDSTGAYTIHSVPPGSYKVEADATGYERQFYHDKADWSVADVVAVTAGNATPDINFALRQERGGVIFGQVVLPNGAPAPHAWVDAESFDHMVHKGEGADQNGNFRIGGLITGTWRLRARPPGGPEYRDLSDSDEVLVPVSFTSAITLATPIRLTRVNVVGRAVMPDGSGAAQVGVDVFSSDFSTHRNTGSDHEGYFRLGGLPVGDYKLELHVPWGMSGIIAPPPRSFRVVDPNARVDLGNIAFIRATKHIVGQVVRGETGAGVPGVEVNASRRGAEGWARTETDNAGRFSLDVAPGRWEVMIHPGPQAGSVDWIFNGAPRLVDFADNAVEETRTVTFTVKTADAHVVGRVEGPNGEKLEPWRVWIDVRDESGGGNHMPLLPDGTFDVPVVSGRYNAWIGVDEHLYPDLSGPRIPPFDVTSGSTRDLGAIRLVRKTSAIQGRVTRSGDGAGLAGVAVHAWQREGGWANATTDRNGNYRLSVLAGAWEVNIEPPYTSTYVTGQPPQRVTVAENQTVSGVDFVLMEAAAVIQGKLYDPAGNLLSSLDGGWAYARQGNAPEPIAGAPVRRGQFSFNVPSGTYQVGVWLPPNAGYTVSGEQQVGPLSTTDRVARAHSRAEVAIIEMAAMERRATARAGATVPITFTLLPNDARIAGGFFVDANKSIPAIGLHGEVFAMGGIGGAWQSAPIDPASGGFELQVAAGAWNLGYRIDSPGYVNSPPPDTRLTVESGQVFTFNFTLVAADATIQGVVKKPDGDPLYHAWAWAHRRRTSTSAAIDTGDDSKPPDGHFSIAVPSGPYEVGAHAPESWGYIQPDVQIVTPTFGSSVSVTLQFKESNGAVTGTVYYHDQAGNPVYGPWAWVWAWSDDGQHTGALTDHLGRYRLNVVTGTTWHVGAVYQAEQGSLFYETITPTDIVMNTPQASADLHLHLASTALPPAAAATFDPSLGWTHTLSDGTRIEIPAGAMPTTDTVRIAVTPLVKELQNTLTARPFGFGYAIVAYEDSTGNQIVSNFNANVLITFHYTEAELDKRGVSEDDLSPAYFSTTTNSWTKVQSYSVDKVANKVTVQINHFSTWSLTYSGKPRAGEGFNFIYLPSVSR